jgi:hypothetical protein
MIGTVIEESMPCARNKLNCIQAITEEAMEAVIATAELIHPEVESHQVQKLQAQKLHQRKLKLSFLTEPDGTKRRQTERIGLIL